MNIAVKSLFISGNPGVGDADIDRWKGKYLRDDYGTYIEEDYEVEKMMMETLSFSNVAP